VVPFLWVNKPDLVPPRVFRLKQSTAGAFTVPLRVLNQKVSRSVIVLLKNLYLLGVTNIQATPTKHNLGTS